MRPSSSEAAKLIGKALISASNHSIPTRSWHPSLEQTLHRLHCRDSLNPSFVARVIDPYLLDHHSLALGFFDWAAQQPGFSHTSLTYQSLLKSLSISRQFNAVDKFLKRIKTHKISLDPSVYRSVIASQIIGKKTQNAFLTFSEVDELGAEIGPDVCNSLLAALASDGFVDLAENVFDKMRVRAIPYSTVGFGVFIGKYCRVAELGKTLHLIEEVKRGVSMVNGSVTAVLIVDGLCRVSRALEASYVLEELRGRGFKPDFIAYRIVAEALRVAGQSAEAERVLKRKRKLGVAPRVSDYKDFIFALVSDRRIQEAKELGEVIIEGNFPMDDDVLNVLIGSVSATHPDSAFLFCKYMLERERFPTLLTLSNLSRSLCKNDKTDEMVEIFQVLSSKDYFSDTESYNVMVSFLSKAGRVREAYSALQDMKKKGFGPDVSSYNSLMEACCREELLRPAKRLWDEMFANGCHGNLKTYNTLIHKFSETGELDEAIRLFHLMMEKEVVPDATSYMSLLNGLCREAKYEAACEIFEKSIEQDTVLAQTILTSLVCTLCKEGKFLAASKVIHAVPPNIENLDSHVYLLKCLADSGGFGVAVEHLRWVRDSSPLLVQAVITELIASLSSCLKPEPVIQLLHAMREKGFISNNLSWMELTMDKHSRHVSRA